MQPSQPRSSEFDRIELGTPLIDRLQDRFGWRIVPVENDPLPVPSEKFGATFRGPLEGISRLQRFYNESFIIQDSFSSHVDRRAFFKDTLGVRAGPWLKEHSKLAANNWNACLLHMSEILGALKRKQVAINPVELNIDEVEAEGREYNSRMSFDQKVEFVTKVDSLILRFFSQLSQIK
jgi:hypothetical protein